MTHPSTLTRREALRRAGMGLGAIASARPLGPAAPRAPPSPARAKRVAAVVTEYRMDSHAEVIVGKVLEGYRHDGGEGPSLKLVSLYVDQFPANDLSRGLAKKHGFK